MTLTPEQQAAFDGFLESDNKFSMLTGYAGTGKSTTVTAIVNRLLGLDNPTRAEDIFQPGYSPRRVRPMRITISAPTHKAVAVLRRMAKDKGWAEYAQFSTVHSLLNMKPKYNEETGEEFFEKSTFQFDSTLASTDILIVDEVSMVGKKPLNDKDPKGLFDYLMHELQTRKLRVLFVGDPAQIPPVKEDDSPLFKAEVAMEYGIKQYSLTQVMRQAMDSPILRFATELRQARDHQPVPEELQLCSTKSGADAIKRIEEIISATYCTEDYHDNPDKVKIIAWRNKTVDYFNLVCRQLIYQTRDLKPLMPGEMILIDKRPYSLDINDPDAGMLSVNTELKVVEIHPYVDRFEARMGRDLVELNVKTFKLIVEEMNTIDEGKVFHTVFVLDPDGVDNFQKILENIKRAIFKAEASKRGDLWKHFFKVRDRYMVYKYNYCITAHKSQGSTYGTAIVMDWDIRVNPNDVECKRIRYVAVTRPKDTLYVVT